MAGNDVLTSLKMDTTNFDANLKKSTDNLSASQRKAIKDARDASAAQATAAKYAADAVSEGSRKQVLALASIKSGYADQRAVQGAINRGNLEEKAGMEALAAIHGHITSQKLALAAASEVQAKSTNRAAEANEHLVVSQRMAASAAVRGLESGNVGIRSVENFITTIPGVGAALQAIFPVIGAAAFIGIIAEMGTKLYDLGVKATHSGEQIKAAFQELHDKAQVTNDDLAIQNDKLRDELALLSGHPGNGLATSLDEARKMADTLLLSLQGDRKELEALLKEHSVGTFASILTGVAATVKQESELLSDRDKLTAGARKVNADFDAAILKVTDPAQIQQLAALRAQQMHDLFDPGIKTLQQESKRLSDQEATTAKDAAKVNAFGQGLAGMQGSPVSGVNNTATKANVQGDIDQRQQMLARELSRSTNFALTAAVAQAKVSKQATGSENKANELRFKAMEAYIATWKTLAPVSAKAIFDYWEVQKSTFAIESAQYNSIVEKQAAIAAAGAEKVAERIKQFKAQQVAEGVEASKLALLNPMEGWNKDAARAAADQRDASNEANAQNARNAARMAEVQIQEASGRTMTAIAAATELAAVHTKEYGAELLRVQERLKAIQTDPSLSSGQDDKQKKIDELQKQISQIQANRGVQVLQDQYNIQPPNTSLLVGATSALEEFVRATTNAGDVLKTVFLSAISSTNDAILKVLTERHTHGQHVFGNAGADIAKSVSGASLKGLEGGLLKALGVGKDKKPTGAKGDPIYTVSYVPGGGIGAGGDDADGGGGNSSGGGFKGFIGKIGSFLGGFADGSTNTGSGWAVVGENGPELARFSSGGQVIPNHQLPSVMGGEGGGGMHFHVDARGSSDPAQTEAAVNRALYRGAPSIMAATLHRQMDQQKRLPKSMSR